ncbi:MAG: DNA-processing protein DprA [Prochlorococcaceae cyanobacterium]
MVSALEDVVSTQGDVVSAQVDVGVAAAGRPGEAGEAWGCTRRRWWLLWARCPGVGWRSIHRLEEGFGGLPAAWSAPVEQLAALLGWGRQRAAQVERYRQRCGCDPLASLLEGPAVLLPGDPALPPQLRQLQRPPLALFWRGQGSLWPLLRRRQAVAVVGTRRPSPHGLAMARAIGAALARAGWPVVSGLAEGIDGAVHGGCLAQAGRPVAVLGTPIDRVYPRHHGPLQQQVASQGILISEQFPGAEVRPGHFAARNRLQVALAQAVVVVECPLRSGALHSAAIAWEQGVPLWAVPADAGKASALGSNRLLASWATPLIDPADLVRQLGPGPLQPVAAPGGDAPAARAPGRRDQELLAAVGQGASLEQLCLQLGEPAAALSTRLLALELAGELRATPGLCWQPA